MSEFFQEALRNEFIFPCFCWRNDFLKTCENLRPENFFIASRWQREADPRPTLEAIQMFAGFTAEFFFKKAFQFANFGFRKFPSARLRSWGFSLLNRCVRCPKSQRVRRETTQCLCRFLGFLSRGDSQCLCDTGGYLKLHFDKIF